MAAAARVITLTTDFGTTDTYVGIMKGVILGINPNVRIVDLTHGIPPQDIYEAAFAIHAAHRYFPKATVHVIVVDPGVGSDRRPIVCEIGEAFFVCPDNGVLSYLLRNSQHQADPTLKAVEIQNAAYCLPEVSNTFHGRDIFAPIAAHLSLGVPISDIGPPVQRVVQLPIRTPELSERTLTGQIIKIDRFGNAISNISERELARLKSAASETATYQIDVSNIRLHRLNRAYAESVLGEPLAIIGSTGLVEIAINGGSANETLGLKSGDPVVIRTFG